MSLGIKLKELRLRNSLSQEQLARKIETTTRTYIFYEKDKKYPPVELLIRMANFFKVSISYLIDEQDEVQTQDLVTTGGLSEFTKSDLQMSFNEQLKELRLHNNLSQEKMSRKLDIVRRTYIYYETGEKFPSVELLTRIAKVFKVSISFHIDAKGEYTVEIRGDST